MRLLIPYTDDRRNGYELRFAIRSMVKHFKPLSGVCIVGDCPTWFNGEHVPAKDIPGRKEWSITSKILQSPYEDFLYSNDDYFALQDFDETIPNYYSNYLNSVKLSGKYVDRAANVKKLYPAGLFYDIHVPMVINLTKYRIANNVPWKDREYLCKSLYGNFVGGGKRLVDVKIRSISDRIPEGVGFFSTKNVTAISAKLETLYPDKCDVEK